MHSEERRRDYNLCGKQTDHTSWCKYNQLLLQCCVFIDVFHKKKLFYKPAIGFVIYHKTGKLSVDTLYCIFNINISYSVSCVYAFFDFVSVMCRAEVHLLKYLQCWYIKQKLLLLYYAFVLLCYCL